MPRHSQGRRSSLPCPGQVVVRSSHAARKLPRAASKLGTSHRLIAPAHNLTLPSLRGVTSRFEASHGYGSIIAPARAMIEQGYLTDKHLSGAESVLEALRAALAEFVERATPPECTDKFGIEIHLTDQIEGGSKHKNALFFVWANTDSPEYIPLRPIFEQLDGNPLQVRLMATLYQWLYKASQKVLPTFGFDEAKNIYAWRSMSYKEARESGEDVDLEGEVEAADPSTVQPYIRDSRKLKLKKAEIIPALNSITDATLRSVFQKAHELFLNTRKICIPRMSPQCELIQREVEAHMDGDTMPGLGLSHWRDDAIVSWLDDYSNNLFESGVSPRPLIMHCFRPNDTRQLIEILRVLPIMVKATFALGEWLQLALGMESAAGYGREDT